MLLALVVRLGLDGVSSGVVVVELLAEVVLPLVDLGFWLLWIDDLLKLLVVELEILVELQLVPC